ncbi:MAG: diguanylate cyclase [Phycisphaerae bacterium]|jgi:diguanylate cyclase (GGDEF)-like protein/putative nucleotidyltransferase with HDIG domain|nr:diguanylate cyclase [Phycisphaerae bacterium]
MSSNTDNRNTDRGVADNDVEDDTSRGNLRLQRELGDSRCRPEELEASREQLQSQVQRLEQEMESAQSEVTFKLAEIAEARGFETVQHVMRVAELAYLLAVKSGLDKGQADTLRLAAAMHDIGKVCIPDSILHSTGKLSPAEFAVMKSHTTVGYEMLKGSSRGVLQAASIIALQHHEKYNGRGYPLGLSKDRINILARITSIADVFDALGSDRLHRKAWDVDDIVEHMRQERGRSFDPMLVDVFLADLDEFQAIRQAFPTTAGRRSARLPDTSDYGTIRNTPVRTSPPDKTGGRAGGVRQPVRVLLCEADQATRELLIMTLGECGYEVADAEDGEQVFEALGGDQAPPLAILDTEMPDGDCISLCRRLRNRPSGDYTYVMLLTGRTDGHETIEALEAGADCCIAKPVNPLELKARLLAAQRVLDLRDELIETRTTLRTQAAHDALTGLWNRPAIMDILGMELNRATRHGTSVGVVIADLDCFKEINDTYEHVGGDAVIRQTARTMRAAFRPYDGFGRYGGQEFLIVLSRCDITFASHVAERLRKCVEKQVVTVGDRQVSLTMSMGVAAQCGFPSIGAHELIQSASKALYRAKLAGRNRVETAKEEDAES